MEFMKLLPNVVGAVGESYVLAELLRRGYVASTLYDCAKDYDLLAYHPQQDRYLKIQVKTTHCEKESKTKDWKLGTKEPYYDDNTFYVFVYLVGYQPPQYYIVHSKTVFDLAEERHNTPTQKGTERSAIRKFVLPEGEGHQDWSILLG